LLSRWLLLNKVLEVELLKIPEVELLKIPKVVGA
jgi:hypothetical protein